LDFGATFPTRPQCFLGDVGNVAGEFLAAESRLANLDLELVDVDRGVGVFLDEGFAHDDGVLEVMALPGEEAHEDVFTQGQFAVLGGGAIGDDLTLLDLVVFLNDGALIETRTIVETDEFPHPVLAVVHHDFIGGDSRYKAVILRHHHHPGVFGHRPLDPSTHDGSFRGQEGDGLSLHVRAHEGAVGVVVFQEWNEARRNAYELLGRDVHVLHVRGVDVSEIAALAGQDLIPHDFPVSPHGGVRRCQDGLHLLVGSEEDYVLRDFRFPHHAVGCGEEAVLIHGRKDS
jgi:hypothetical protein